jgi:hypothetical protein
VLSKIHFSQNTSVTVEDREVNKCIIIALSKFQIKNSISPFITNLAKAIINHMILKTNECLSVGMILPFKAKFISLFFLMCAVADVNAQEQVLNPDSIIIDIATHSDTSLTQQIREVPSSDNPKSKYNEISWANLPYIFDDLMITGGVSYGGVYQSKEFRNLGYTEGWQFGIQGYIPITEKAFFNFGVNYAQRNFVHKIENIKFYNQYLDIPLIFAYELPVFRGLDFRFLLGYQAGFRLASSQSKDYSDEVMNTPELFKYNHSEFNVFDAGLTAGVSIEYQSFYMRLRSYTGHGNLMKSHQGMMHTMSLDLGYLLFRNLRQF